MAGSADGTSRRRAQATVVGFEHVAFLRLVVTDAGVRAEAVGTGHRLPHSGPISLGLATRLIEDGVPVVVHDREPAIAPEPSGHVAERRAPLRWLHRGRGGTELPARSA